MALGFLAVFVRVEIFTTGVDAARPRADHRELPVRTLVKDEPDSAARVPVFLGAEHYAQPSSPLFAAVPFFPFTGVDDSILVTVSVVGIMRLTVTIDPARVVFDRNEAAIRALPLAYDPACWGAVFPLGMYTACTQRMPVSLRMPFLLPIPRGCVYIALSAWLLTSVGLVLQLRNASRPPGTEHSELSTP